MTTTLVEAAEPVKADPEAERRENDIAGLRELVDWFESHPEVPLPFLSFNIYANTAEQFATIRRLMGANDKRDAGEYLYFSKYFSGDVQLDLNINKEKTCRKVKVGTKVLPAEPAKPERTEDVYEWKCSSILEPAQPTTATE